MPSPSVGPALPASSVGRTAGMQRAGLASCLAVPPCPAQLLGAAELPLSLAAPPASPYLSLPHPTLGPPLGLSASLSLARLGVCPLYHPPPCLPHHASSLVSERAAGGRLTVGVTGGLDCHPLPQRLLLISCPAAQPRGRGGRRDDSCLQRRLPSLQCRLQPGSAGEEGTEGLPDERRGAQAQCSVTGGGGGGGLPAQPLWAPAASDLPWWRHSGIRCPQVPGGRWALGQQAWGGWGPWGGRREELEAVSGHPQEGHLGHSCCRSRRLPRQPPALSPLAPGHPHTGTEIASF